MGNMSNARNTRLGRWMGMLLLAVLLGAGMAGEAAAQTVPPTGTPAPAAANADDYCTDMQKLHNEAFNSGKSGILSEIYWFLKDVVGTATYKLFSAFTDNDAYQNAVFAAMVLMVVFFGIGFTIGVVQASFQQVLVRMIKLGLIAAVISPTGWIFFSQYVVSFFQDGTDDLIKGVVYIGTGVNTPLPPNASPFYQFDQLANFVIQPETLITIMGATFAGGPYGMAMGGLMGIAIWGFFDLIIKALKLYASTFVARALLLGVAPIFIVFLLFDRTKQMFTSWLNALLSMSLQPILMFTFLSFFMVMIESAGKDMLSADLCWTEFSNMQGTTAKASFWRFRDKRTGELMTSQMTWEGSIQCLISGKGVNGEGCPEFPINIIDILSFLVLVYIAQRFSEVIDRIANDLSNTYISLDAGGKIEQFMSQAGRSLGRGR